MSTAEIRSLISSEIATLTREVIDPLPPYGFGSDIAGWVDMDPNDNPTANQKVALAQAAIRRLVTPRGTLPGDEDYGIDLREVLHKPLIDGTLLKLSMDAAAELRKDDRVKDASVILATNGRDAFEITVRLTPADTGQEFTFTGTITAIGVEALVVS